jgi:hypothetical protein
MSSATVGAVLRAKALRMPSALRASGRASAARSTGSLSVGFDGVAPFFAGTAGAAASRFAAIRCCVRAIATATSPGSPARGDERCAAALDFEARPRCPA